MKKCLGCFKDIKDELEICPFCGYIVGTEAEEATHLIPGTKLADRYIIGKVIGYGGFGVTYIAWDTTLEMRVAIKEYLPSEFSTRVPGIAKVTVFTGEKAEQFNDGLNKFVEEAMKLVKFQNEDGIVKVFDCIKENGTAYIIMEYLEGCTLDVYLKEKKTIPEDEAVELLMPIMLSLQTVHDEGILHRDIAPENIFITNDGKSKLIDFGASRFATTSHSRSLTVIVKPGYSPEEQYRSRGDQGPHTDVYSIAATLYKAITGTTPPDALERRAKVETSKRDIIVDPSKLNKNISQRRENAIMNALNVQIEDRTKDIQQFITELNSSEPVPRRYGNIKKIDFYKWPLWLKIAAPSLLALIVLIGVLIITGVIHFENPFSNKVNVPDGYVMVPNVLNMSTTDAYQVIEESGLQYTIGGTLANPYQEVNTIIYQSPESEKYALKNSILLLTVCEGDGSDMMLIYKSSDEIGSYLEEKNVKYEIIEEYNDSVNEGLVSRITLDDGTEILSDSQIPNGRKAILYVSLGPKPFPMPDLYGMTLEQAQNKLTECGLVLDVTNVGYEKSEALEPGHVLKQSISSGTDVKKGTSVSVTLVAEKELIEVADVTNMNKDDAKKTLENQGFKVSVSEENSSSVSKGNVISQTPAGGTKQKEKTDIYIIVSKGPKKSTTTSTTSSTSSKKKKTTETESTTAYATEATATPTPTEEPTPTPTEQTYDPASYRPLSSEQAEVAFKSFIVDEILYKKINKTTSISWGIYDSTSNPCICYYYTGDDTYVELIMDRDTGKTTSTTMRDFTASEILGEGEYDFNAWDYLDNPKQLFNTNDKIELNYYMHTNILDAVDNIGNLEDSGYTDPYCFSNINLYIESHNSESSCLEDIREIFIYNDNCPYSLFGNTPEMSFEESVTKTVLTAEVDMCTLYYDENDPEGDRYVVFFAPECWINLTFEENILKIIHIECSID